LAVSLCKRDYVGVAEQIIEQLIDEELDKRAFIEIVIRRILHNELSELKNRALLQGAKDAGAVWWLPRGCIRRRLQVCEQQTSLIPICKALLRISVKRGVQVWPKRQSTSSSTKRWNGVPSLSSSFNGVYSRRKILPLRMRNLVLGGNVRSKHKARSSKTHLHSKSSTGILHTIFM
jgi:hypothetical protein